MRFPAILSQSTDRLRLDFELDIVNELIWFRGHFPGFPVLPGVVQLRWAVEMAQRHFGFTSSPHEVLRLKFKGIIVPPRAVQLTVLKTAPCEASFEYTGQGEIYSQGKLRFADSGQ